MLKKLIFNAATLFFLTNQAQASTYQGEFIASGGSEINEPGFDIFGPGFSYFVDFSFDNINKFTVSSNDSLVSKDGNNFSFLSSDGASLQFYQTNSYVNGNLTVFDYTLFAGNLGYQQLEFMQYGELQNIYVSPQVFYSNASLYVSNVPELAQNSLNITNVPLPSTLALFVCAILLLGLYDSVKRKLYKIKVD